MKIRFERCLFFGTPWIHNCFASFQWKKKFLCICFGLSPTLRTSFYEISINFSIKGDKTDSRFRRYFDYGQIYARNYILLSFHVQNLGLLINKKEINIDIEICRYSGPDTDHMNVVISQGQIV